MAGECYRCGGKIDAPPPVSRSELCPGCGAYVRCCLNCDFYDESYHNKCREPQSETVSDRETANFCDFFRIASKEEKSASGLNPEETKSRFDALFKK